MPQGNRKMNEFKTYHPVVNFIYFVFVIGFSMFFMNPVCLFVSLICSFVYFYILNGRKAVCKNLIYIFIVMLTAAFINTAFNHEGITVLYYFPDGNPLTFESVVYGIASAVMLINVIVWFSCYSSVMTSDKFIYLFGKIIPSLSLIFSMTLSFIPKFSDHLKEVRNAQKCIGRDMSEGNIIKRAKNGISVLSIMTTWALENAIDTADSMKSRGYGLNGRTAFSIYNFDKRDFFALIFIIIFGIYTLIGCVSDGIYFRYFPSFKMTDFNLYSVSIYLSYFILCIFPVIIEMKEARKWNALKSKI